MKPYMDNDFEPPPRSRVLNCVLLLAVLCLSLLRFVNLNADFPSHITWSGVLYTDEGWYANAAVRHMRTNNWYLAGDFNPAINMPVGQILHRFTFSLFGISLSSARITTVVSFVFLVVLTALFVHRSFGGSAAMLTALLLSTNYIGFAFSRLAIMEIVAMFFVVASLLVTGGLKGKGGLARLSIASVLLGAGILTKTTAVFAVPLLAYLAWRCGQNRKERIAFLAASGLVLLFVVGGYLVIAKLKFPEDFAYFSQLNLKTRMHKNLADWLVNIPKVVLRMKVLGIDFVGLTVLFTAFALLLSKRYRREPLTHILAGYIAAYMVVLSLVSYRPPRYYLPLLVPFAGLCSTACTELSDWLRKTRWSSATIASIIPMILVAAVSLHGSWKIITYVSNPSFSFSRMAHEVDTIIQEQEGTVSDVVLFGQIADSVALEIGIHPVNTGLGTLDLDRKLRKYRPRYLLIHTDEEILETVRYEGGDVTKLASWDVYDNYYGNGQQVQLMLVHWNGEHGKSPTKPCRATPEPGGS